MDESVIHNGGHSFAPAIIIPVYNHETAVIKTVQSVLKYKLPVLLVDDGSEPHCEKVLVDLQSRNSHLVMLSRLRINCGKGAAIKHGLRQLHKDGYSHAVQIDADGQHNTERLPEFVQLSAREPKALIIAYPKYDESVPRLRYYARYLTHVWVWINTLSTQIVDTMCGYRIYPIAETLDLLDHSRCGDRMEFDTEIVVRWQWRDNPVVQFPTPVHYPAGGISHFRLWRDNCLISLMHTRLFFGMLIRLPRLLERKLRG